MKKLLLTFLTLISFGFAFAADVDHFVVEVDPNPVKVNEAADLTLKAVDSNGDTVEDYDGSVIMEAQLNGKEAKDATLPWWGTYTFEAQDKWVKKFSKWLKFISKWDYNFIVSDMNDMENIKTEEKVSVTDDSESGLSGTVTITSPERWSTEKWNTVKVIWNSSIFNSPLEVYIDEQKVSEWTTDENWDFNIIVDNVDAGAHILQVKIVDVDNTVKAESDVVDFTLEADAISDNFFKSIKILPSNTVYSGDKITVVVETIADVSSAEVEFTWRGNYMMEKSENGKFTKDLVASKAGAFPANLKLIANGNQKSYPNVEKLTVLERTGIKYIKCSWDKTTDGDLTLSWQFDGSIPQFKVAYWTWKTPDQMGYNIQSPTNQIVLHWLNKNNLYYAQIYPLNNAGIENGSGSEIISSDMCEWHGSSETVDMCLVSGIKLYTWEESGKFFLKWDPVPDTNGYIIYKSDTPSKDFSTMQKVGETTDLKWEYPFDPHAKKEIWNYYAVVAKCNSGKEKQIDEVKKVKVWPLDNILILILFAAFIYWGYKLIKFSK